MVHSIAKQPRNPRCCVPTHFSGSLCPSIPHPSPPTPRQTLLFQLFQSLLFRSNGASSLICSQVSSRLAIIYRLPWCHCCSACAHLLVVVCRLSFAARTCGCRYCCCCCRCRGGWEARCEKGPVWLFGHCQVNDFGSP